MIYYLNLKRYITSYKMKDLIDKIKSECTTAYFAAEHYDNSRRRTLMMHRFILGLEFGDKRVADHIDRDGRNNCKTNLRIVTQRQNTLNRRGRNKFKGVCFTEGKWRAMISIGSYDTGEEAAKAYDKAAKYFYGEYAYLNFPDEKPDDTS